MLNEKDGQNPQGQMLLQFKTRHRWYQILLGPKITSYLHGFTNRSLSFIIFFSPQYLDQDFSSIQIGMDSSIRPLLSYIVKKWKPNFMREVSLFSLHLERSFMVKLLSSATFKWWNFEIITLIQEVAEKTENSSKWQAELNWTPTSSDCLSYGCENKLQRFKNLYV